MDLNNNEPNIALLNNIMPINSFSPLNSKQNLIARIKENEVGPILFDPVNSPKTENKYYIAYDPDLGENGEFNLNFMQSVDTSGILNYPINEIKSHLVTNPYSDNQILNKNTINLISKNSFDFESLNLNSTLDPYNKIGSKLLKFGVIK